MGRSIGAIWLVALCGCSALTDFSTSGAADETGPMVDARADSADARVDAAVDARIDAVDAQPDVGPPDATPDVAPPPPDAAPPCTSTRGCDDGNACTIDRCEVTGQCSHLVRTCSDGISCTVDSCDPQTGCMNQPDAAQCNDGADCTIDACDTIAGCTHTPQNARCDDNELCTEDLCVVSALSAHCEYRVMTNCISCNRDKPCPGPTCEPCGIGLLGMRQCKYTCKDDRCDKDCGDCKVGSCRP